MRKWNRLKTFLPLLLAFCASSTLFAQAPGSYSSYAPTYMSGAPGYYGATGHNGLPPSFQSHPGISPFDHALEQHFTSDGLWFKRSTNGFGPGANPNSYFFNVNYVRTRFRGLDGIFGDPDAPPHAAEDDFSTRPLNDDEDYFYNSFNAFNSKQLGSPTRNGIEGNWGFEHRDGWKFNLKAHWTGNRTSTYDLRNILQARRMHYSTALTLETVGSFPAPNGRVFGTAVQERSLIESEILGGPDYTVFDATDAVPYGVLGNTFDILDRNLFVLNGLPLQNGVDVLGHTQTFDLDFIVRHSIETYGAAAAFSSAPIIDNDRVTLRSVIGGRFYHIDENFRFDGVDSGLGYTPATQDGVDDDDDFIIDNVDEGGGATFTQINPSATGPMYRAFLDSTVRSQLFGPEFGLEYDLGKSSGLDITGSTRVGLLVNKETLGLAGNNIGNMERLIVATEDRADGTVTGDTVLEDSFDTASGLNAFQDEEGTTHLSPMFEQSLSAKVGIFHHVPVLKDMWQLEHAKLQVGWTYLWIGEVADPANSAVIESRPIDGVFPFIRTKRRSFYQNSFFGGINWEY